MNNMDKTLNFMSVQNLQNLMTIFEKFMTDRYSINIQDNPNIKIKQIIYETMNKVKQQSYKQNISLIDLNKITLSIVKNVIKQKLSLDSSNYKNSSLMRDRDVQKNKTNNVHNRPQPSNNSSMYSYDVNQQFDEISNIRAKENTSFISNTALPTNDSLDDALSTDEFVKKLNSLEQLRDMNSTILPSDKSLEEDNSNNTWLSDVYKNNSEIHPKELYNSKINQQEHFTQPNDVKETLLRDITDNNSIIKRSADVTVPKTNTKYLILDSRDRDVSKYQNASEYIIELDNLVKNVLEIKFWYAQYKKNTGTTEYYINLHIDEFDTDNMSVNNNFKDAFIQLPLTSEVMSVSGSDLMATKTFQSPLNKLNRLHIKFTTYNGDLYNMEDHLLKFQVTFIQSDQVIEQNVLDKNIETTYADEIIHNNDLSVPVASNTEIIDNAENM